MTKLLSIFTGYGTDIAIVGALILVIGFGVFCARDGADRQKIKDQVTITALESSIQAGKDAAQKQADTVNSLRTQYANTAQQQKAAYALIVNDLKGKLENEIRKPVYHNAACVVPTAGISLLNEDIAGANATTSRKPAGALSVHAVLP